MKFSDDFEDRFIRLPELLRLVPVSKSTIYRLEAKGAFPPRIYLSPNCIAWRLSDIIEWMTERQVKAMLSAENNKAS